jgi:MATE family multidrug resistance protein
MNFELRKILQIAIPSTIAWIGHIGYNIVDNIMIGRILGSEALAISGIASAIYFIFLIFGMGASGIIVALTSEASVKRSSKALPEAFQNSLVFCLILGFFLWSCVFFFGDTIILLVNKQPQLNSHISSYLKILSFALIPVMIFFCFEKLCEGVGKTKPAMYTTILCNFNNAFFNYAFLTGSFGFPNLGVKGTAVSSTFNICMEVIIIVTLLKFNKHFSKALNIKKIYVSLKKVREIAKLGLPGGILLFCEACAFNVASFMASKVSVLDVAAHQIILWLVNGFLTPIYGLSVAVTSRVALNVAEDKNKTAYNIALKSTFYAATLITIFMCIFYIFGEQIVKLMLKGDASDYITLKLVLSVLPILILIEVFDASQVMLASALRGYKDTFYPSMFAILSYWGVCIPAGFIFGIIMNMGVYGIWLGLGSGLLVQFILLFSRLIIKFRKA